MVDRTGDLPRRIEFSPCSQGGVPLPGGGEQGADYRRAIDLARVGVDPTVVHRPLGNHVELLRGHPDIAQPGRQAETGDQLGRRHVGPAEWAPDVNWSSCADRQPD